MTSKLLLAIAELALRVVPPLLRAARRDTPVTDVARRQRELLEEIERVRRERALGRRVTR